MPTLTWRGKDAVLNHHLDVPYRLLKCEPELSAGAPGQGNLIVEGDNLQALKALLPYYKGQVKCIYIDPPYNTGDESWSYNDAVNSPEMREWLGKVVGKETEDLNRHDKWLCMMWPRLQLLKQFLHPSEGSVWISIDDNEIHSLRMLMDEIFGRGRFVTARLDAKGHELELQNLDASQESHLPYGMSGSEDPVHLSQRLDLLLHRNGSNRDVPQHLGRRWCLDLLMALQAKGQVLPELDRGRFRLAGAVDQYWASHRQRLRQEGFAAALMDTEAFASSPSQHFAFGPEDEYNPTALSPSIYSRHRYLRVGGMNGEELQVALALDNLPSVAQWVRNLEHSRTACFWLQASLQAFFPDFVALLKDGRTLVVEYKGAHLIAKDQDKKAVGERWAAATGNAFEWVTEDRLPTLLETWFKRYPAP